MDLPDKTQNPQPKKKVEAVVSGASKASRPATRRFFDFLFAESPKQLGAKVARDVLVPRAKAGIEEALTSFLHGMMWGGGQPPMSQVVRQAMLRGGGTNYTAISSPPMGLQQARAAVQTRSSGNYQDLLLPTQEAAEIILANAYDILNQYRVVTVADLYELAGLNTEISDNAYGWASLDGARITSHREGYLLELARPTLI